MVKKRFVSDLEKERGIAVMSRNKQKKASIRSLMILTLIVIGVCAAYLLINAYPEKPKLFQYILSLRIPTLIVMLIAAFSIGSASIIFQSIINNRIVTPCFRIFWKILSFTETFFWIRSTFSKTGNTLLQKEIMKGTSHALL